MSIAPYYLKDSVDEYLAFDHISTFVIVQLVFPSKLICYYLPNFLDPGEAMKQTQTSR
jgi:hypothetical protein